jgi:16S rRNA U516 pseudouridylate synthase RsuA-like enzyme
VLIFTARLRGNMKRSELKQLVKECLVELLQDGIGSVSAKNETDIRETVAGTRKHIAPRQKQQQANKPNDLMSRIFEDTARTTLKTLIDNDKPGGLGTEHVTATPEQIFGKNVVDSWESLAFD